MLVGRCVIDDLRLVLGDEGLELLLVPDVAERGDQLGAGRLIPFHHVVVKMGLVVVHGDDPGGHEAEHLVHDLGPDRAAGPGDQHRLAVENRLHCLEIGGDRRAEQEVLDLQVPDVGTSVVSGEQLVEIGDDPQPDVDVDTEVDQPTGEDAGALGGDDHLLDVQCGHQRGDVLQLADDRKVGQTLSLRRRPGADKADDVDLVGAGVAGQVGGALAGAENEHPVPGVEPETAVEREETGAEADCPEEAERDHRPQDQDRQGHRPVARSLDHLEVTEGENDEEQDRRCPEGGGDDPTSLADAGELPDMAIGTHRDVGDEMDPDDHRQGDEHPRPPDSVRVRRRVK